jgi:RNA polymerase sigma-70 factor (ECF subfamily)
MIGQDSRLIREAKAGNKRAFGKLVKKYEKKILFLSYDLCGNYEDAKDVAQDVFIKSFEKLSQFEERSEFLTWLYRITVNMAIDFHRQQKRSRQRFVNDDLLHAQKLLKEVEILNPSKTMLEELEQRDQIERVLKKLSMNQRTATVLKYFHHKTTKEIADIMGCQETTVRNHIFRALGNLKKHLENLA